MRPHDPVGGGGHRASHALARVERLELLPYLYEQLIVPPAVHAELALNSDRPGARALSGAFNAGWLTVGSVTDSGLVGELARLLGPGEAESIVLAEQEDACFFLVDDARGRPIARLRGILVVGVAGVILAAKSRGEVVAVGSILGALSNSGYRLSPRLVAGVLARAIEVDKS